MTEEQYYSSGNSENTGNYQFVFLEDLVNNFIQGYLGDDSLLGQVPRHRVVGKMKHVIKELTFTALHYPKVVELDLGEALDVIKPSDFVSYIRISWVDKTTGIIRPMSVNRHTPLGIAYLQDHTGAILFDQDGDILQGTTLLEQESNKQGVSILEGDRCVNEYTILDKPIYNLDTSINHNGTFSETDNRFHFSSESALRTILLEYVSDNLSVDESLVKVHKFAEKAVYESTHYELAKMSMKLPNYEKANLRKERDAAVRNAKVKLLGIRPNEFIQQLKAFNRWIK